MHSEKKQLPQNDRHSNAPMHFKSRVFSLLGFPQIENHYNYRINRLYADRLWYARDQNTRDSIQPDDSEDKETAATQLRGDYVRKDTVQEFQEHIPYSEPAEQQNTKQHDLELRTDSAGQTAHLEVQDEKVQETKIEIPGISSGKNFFPDVTHKDTGVMPRMDINDNTLLSKNIPGREDDIAEAIKNEKSASSDITGSDVEVSPRIIRNEPEPLIKPLEHNPDVTRRHCVKEYGDKSQREKDITSMNPVVSPVKEGREADKKNEVHGTPTVFRAEAGHKVIQERIPERLSVQHVRSNHFQSSTMQAIRGIGSIRDALKKLTERLSVQEDMIARLQKQKESEDKAPVRPIQNSVYIKHSPTVSRTPSAFWERSHLNHRHLRILR